jgi:hypothetical protein
VTVRENQTGDLAIEYRGRTLGFQQIPHRPARQPTPCSVSAPRGGHRTHSPNHLWNQSPKRTQTTQVSL